MADSKIPRKRGPLDLSGMRFGKVVVVERVDVKNGQSRWLCRCDCGAVKTLWRTALTSGETTSCGCAWLRNKARIHGHNRKGKRSGTYETWASMIKRVTNPRYIEWRYYGGRGIGVCDRWRTFGHFLDDMGERPVGKTLDRINVDGDYSLNNCRWATVGEQRANRRDARDRTVSLGQ